MAKICINCGAKIGIFEYSSTLSHTKVSFCEKCRKLPDELLNDVRMLSDSSNYKKVKAEFQSALESSGLNSDIKHYLWDEFQQIAANKTETNYTNYAIKRFAADFEESYEAVRTVGKELTCDEVISNPPVINTGNTKVSTFAFEQYFFRNGSYASLTITLVNYNGISTIISCSSGGGDGLLNLSWGAEEDFVNDFWIKFRDMYPQFETEGVPLESLEYPEKI